LKSPLNSPVKVTREAINKSTRNLTVKTLYRHG
jgi:hypothetical protein